MKQVEVNIRANILSAGFWHDVIFKYKVYR